jgi:hypothetical protein
MTAPQAFDCYVSTRRATSARLLLPARRSSGLLCRALRGCLGFTPLTLVAGLDQDFLSVRELPEGGEGAAPARLTPNFETS